MRRIIRQLKAFLSSKRIFLYYVLAFAILLLGLLQCIIGIGELITGSDDAAESIRAIVIGGINLAIGASLLVSLLCRPGRTPEDVEAERRLDHALELHQACEDDCRAVIAGELSWDEAVEHAATRWEITHEEAREGMARIRRDLELRMEARARYRAGATPEEVAPFFGSRIENQDRDKEEEELDRLVLSVGHFRSQSERLAWECLCEEMAALAQECRAPLSLALSPVEKLALLRAAGIAETLARRTLFAYSILRERISEYPDLAQVARTAVSPREKEPSFEWAETDLSKADAGRIASLAYHWEPWSEEALRRRSQWREKYRDIVDDLVLSGFTNEEAKKLASRPFSRKSRTLALIGLILAAIGSAGMLGASHIDGWGHIPEGLVTAIWVALLGITAVGIALLLSAFVVRVLRVFSVRRAGLFLMVICILGVIGSVLCLFLFDLWDSWGVGPAALVLFVALGFIGAIAYVIGLITGR